MNFFRRIFFKIIGVKTYLLVISRLSIIAFFTGLLKFNRDYDCHYFVKNLVNKGDTIINIGANLGYYSLIFSKLVGKRGIVFSVEPVELFREILSKNTRNQTNIQIIPYAIGASDNQKIQMGIPLTSGYFCHGRTHVLTSEENCSMIFDAIMMRPDAIFRNLGQLNLLKCDIEGYENIAIPLFKELILQFRPILQIEIIEKNRRELIPFILELGYSAFEVKRGKLCRVHDQKAPTFGDLLFIDNNKIENYSRLVAS